MADHMITKNLVMVDLKQQYEKIKPEIDQALQEVISSSQFIKGPVVQTFENELANYNQVQKVIGCANGTDALQLALMALDLKPGDEVIVPSFTFIATAEVVALLGLKPVLVDVDLDYFNIDIASIERALSPQTKAIIPVHLFGQCAPMHPIMQIAQEKGLYVIEDNAQAIGSDYTFNDGETRKSGSIGHIGCTSFFPSKNLGAYGDGGAVFCNDPEMAERIEVLANHGMKRRYYHDLIGINSRLDAIQAAILKVKLRYLDAYNKARWHAAQHYNEALAKISQVEIPKEADYSTHVYHQYTLQVKDRDDLFDHLQSLNIPCAIYYPMGIHQQSAYQRNYKETVHLPNTEKLSENVISLPMHTELETESIYYICSKIKEFYR